ncbi:MAG TPA: dTDP-4-dehydrorhamnose 3,5-epimerase [Microscillaceae bacterium]|jgi:dTDP-4-dehydrorhamnose 3,5-epimerase|nr:dTDP-4-dehydrorhamnose 3,5-epimerase [Microscillaceae bacterium]
MPYIETPLTGLWVFEPRIFEDERGYFYESFNMRQFQTETGIDRPFVQDNISFSQFGVLRGFHFQYEPAAQAKLVSSYQGAVWDVVVDLRPQSPTFGQSFQILISAENKKQLYVPRGFAHSFVVISPEGALFGYKCDNFYAPQYESGIRYDDPDLQIDWQVEESALIVSDKDKLLPSFAEVKEHLAQAL